MSANRRIQIAVYPLLILLALIAPAGAASIEDRLAAARLELEIGLATEERILTELEAYRASPDASPERIALYETYLDRVRQLTEEKRKIVQRLEQALRRSAASTTGSPEATLPPPDLDIPEDKELDELRALQRELDQSIAAFDDMLLTESELARVDSELKMKQLAQEAAEAARGLRESEGGEDGEGGEGSEGETGMEDGESSRGGEQGGQSGSQSGMAGMEGDEGDADQQGGEQESGGGQDRSKRAAKSTQGKGSEASAGQAQQPAGTQDDDIVARQLREAAEKETDPVLKERLWKEYYDYKKGL